MKIAVIDDYQDAFRNAEAYGELAGHDVTIYRHSEKDPLRLAERLQDAEAVVLTQQRSRFTQTTIERLPKLRLVSQTGRHVAHIDMAACTQKGIVVAAGGAGVPNPTAELAWGLIISALRHIPEEVGRLRSGHWQHTLGVSVAGKTLGIYAYGRIGSIVGRVGKAFGMLVMCWGREGSTAKARQDGYEVAASREAFFRGADIVSLHLPLNGETRGIVTADDLALMKPTALIVNTSRAPIIAEGALVAALTRGHPGFAAVDVYEDEPVLNAEHPLLHMKNALCTPHLGYVEQQAMQSHYRVAVDQILAFASGKPINVINPEVLARKA